jgi:hypothetical protein
LAKAPTSRRRFHSVFEAYEKKLQYGGRAARGIKGSRQKERKKKLACRRKIGRLDEVFIQE